MGRLADKICIVTGATSGIGRRTVEVFHAEGATVVFAGRREPLGEVLQAELGERAHFRRCDVSLEEEVAALITWTAERFGRVDVLFNNAGGPAPTGGIETMPVDRAEEALKTLFSSVLSGMKHVAPVMRRAGRGSIINNASIAGSRAGYSSSIVYSAAKAAVIQLSKCVAMELGESGIRVNTISPGAIATGIFGKALGFDQAKSDRSAEIVRSAFADLQPIKRAGLPEDIARAALFLASDESTFINGLDMVVDGGITLGRLWTPQQQALAQMRAALGALPD